MLSVGIIGCGRIGQVHARSIKHVDGVRLTAVADAFAESAQKLASESGADVRDANTLIASSDIDAVIICTPTDTHYDLIHTAAAEKKAIFCEKPVDLDADRIRDCVKAVDAAGVGFMTAFNRRFDPNFAHLEQSLRDGVIGGIELVTIQSRDPSPPPISYITSSGGIFRDMMIHDIDMARFLLGEEPVELSATGSSLVDPAIGEAGDFDTAALTLKTASGKICQISNSRRASYGYDQRIEVHGSDGMLRADNVHENSVELANGDGFRRAPAKHFFLERYEAAYQAEMRAFLASMMNGKPIKPTIEDGLKAQIIADLAAECAQSGSGMVALDYGLS